MQDIFQKIAETQRKGIDVALCIIVNTKGSTPRESGAKMLVYPDGKIYGTIGGGDLEKNVIVHALEVLESKVPSVFKHDLLHQHNMCCGGSVEIYIEPIMKKNKLYIFGAGHTGLALAKYAVNFNFEVVLIDDRKEYMDEVMTEGINKLNLHYEQALPLLPFDENTFITIMTYSHPYDRDILAYCLKKPFAYLGMIGSKRKVAMTKKMFSQSGIGTMEELEKVDMPMGIEIGAEDPEEIAISILSKLIAIKNKVGEKISV
jgi:xanthine dehydrogenase accessory factor